MAVPRWLIFFITDLGLHAAHHIEPRIPIWKLDAAQRHLGPALGDAVSSAGVSAFRLRYSLDASSTTMITTFGSTSLASRRRHLSSNLQPPCRNSGVGKHPSCKLQNPGSDDWMLKNE